MKKRGAGRKGKKTKSSRLYLHDQPSAVVGQVQGICVCIYSWEDDGVKTLCFAACIENDIEQLDWTSAEALVALSISVLGLLATTWVTVVFCLHNNTPIVKASTRELSYIILVGIALSYTATFVLIATPTAFTCGAGRIIPGVSFSLIYGALVTKTNRIARILAGSKKKIMTRKPRFMSASAQVSLEPASSCLQHCFSFTSIVLLEHRAQP